MQSSNTWEVQLCVDSSASKGAGKQGKGKGKKGRRKSRRKGKKSRR